MRVLERAGRPLRIPAGSTVYHAGERGDAAYLVTSGAVRITVPAGGDADLGIARIGPGGMFGAEAALAGRERTTSAVAIEETELDSLCASALADIVEREPAVARWLLDQALERIRSVERTAAAQCGDTTDVRLARHLLEAAGAGTARVTTTQSDLAGWIGTSRESAARALSDLRARGVVTTGRGWVEVVDVEALRALT